MSKRKATLGIAVLVALALSAFTAASASATGLTAFTCVKDANGTLIGPHCDGVSGEKYKHVEIKQDETTTGTWTNANTAAETTAASSATLTETIAGVATEITCAEVHGEGTFMNKKNAGGEHYFHYEGSLHFTKCEVKKPAGKGCKIASETITWNPVTISTEGVQQPGLHTTSVKPKEGTKFGDIKIEGCSVESLNNTFPLTGSFKPKAGGATMRVTSTEVTTQNTLKFGGQKAGVDLVLTPKAHKKPAKEGEEPEETKPLSFTTIP